MTRVSSFENSPGNISSDETSTDVQNFLYYLSFFLVYATLTFIASMLLMNFEDRTGSLLWNESKMKMSDKVGIISFYFLQFPLGLLFGFLTGNYNNAIFSIILNPIFIGWLLEKTYVRKSSKKTKAIFRINYLIWIIIILTIIIFVYSE